MKIKELKINPYILAGAIVAIIVFMFAGFRCSTGKSMEPTMKSGSPAFSISRKIYNKEIERFDIVDIDLENDSEGTIQKRIIGLPGEKVVYKDGNVFINGELIENPYIENMYDGTFKIEYAMITLGEDEYFVLGDNQGTYIEKGILNTSKDSRFFGAVKDSEIKSFVLFSF